MRYFTFTTAVGLACTTLASTNAFSDALDEIIVTAQKRQQSAQDVPIAIATVSGKELEDLNLQNSTDIARVIPGVNVAGSYGGQLLTFTIRGVSQYDFSHHTEAPNAMYVDEGYLASQQMQNFGLFDVDQIEVLKGPQGTLFGHNATGGAIVITTRKPTTTEDGYARVTYGRFDQLKFEGAYGGPITDTLSARVSLYYDKFGPYLRNYYPGGASENNDNTQAGRVQVRYQPNDDLRLDVSAFGSASTFGTSPYNMIPTINVCNAAGQVTNSLYASPTETREAIGANGANTPANCGAGTPLTRTAPGGDFNGYRVVGDPRFVENKDFASSNFGYSNITGVTTKLTYNFGRTTFTSVSDYKRNDVKLGLEFDESPTPYLDSATTAKVEQISQEFRLNGSTQRDRWVAGLYYLDVDEHTPTSGIIVAPISLDLRDKFNQYLSSYALYGQNEFDLLDKLTLTTGLRASRERKKFHYEDNLYSRDSYNTNPASSPFIANARLFDGTSQETLWGGRIELSYRPQDHLMIYGGYNRGTKGGGFNAPLGGSALIPNSDIPYKPEELSAYEAGFKSEFFDQAARFNGTAFYYDYHNYQAYKAIGAADAVQNYQATAKGAEADLLVRPTPGLTLSASGAYIDYVVKNVSYLGITADRENVKTPPLTFATAVRYELPLGTGKVAVQGDAKYMGHQYYCVCNFESTRIPAYAVANAQVSYTTAQDRLVFSAHVDNIADKIYKVTGFDFSGTTGSSFVGYGTPRWWGITVQYNLRKSDQ